MRRRAPRVGEYKEILRAPGITHSVVTAAGLRTQNAPTTHVIPQPGSLIWHSSPHWAYLNPVNEDALHALHGAEWQVTAVPSC